MSNDDFVIDIETEIKNSLKKINKLEKEFENLSKSIDNDMHNATKKSEGHFSSFSKKTIGFIGGVVVAYATLTTAISGVDKVISETGKLETATVKWEVLTGSISEAEKTMKEIFDFSNSTPFTFKSVETAASIMYNLTDGAIQGADALKLLGDRAAKANQPIEEIAVWWGRLYSNMQAGRPIGEAMARLQEIGVVSGSLRNELEKFSKSDMMSGKAWDRFLEGTSNANGMMEKLSQTIEGKRSTLSGVWDGVFGFDDKLLQDRVKKSLDEMIDLLTENKGLIQDFFSFSLEVFSKSVNGALSLMKGYMSYVDRLRNTLGGASEGAKLNALEDKYKGQNNVDLSRTSSSLNLERKTIEAQIRAFEKGLVKDKGFDYALKMTQKAIKNDPYGLTSEYRDAEPLAKLYKKLSDITNERIAVEKILFEQQKLEVAGVGTKTTEPTETNKRVEGEEEPYDIESELAEMQALRDKMTEKYYSDELAISKYEKEQTAKIEREDHEELLQLEINNKAKLLEEQAKFYSDSIAILESSNASIVGFHKAFTSDTISGILSGLSGGTSGIGGILSTLGLADPTGIAGIAAGVFGIGSTIASFFESGDSSSNASSSSITDTATNRPEIVSSARSVIVNNYVDINTSYIGNDQGVRDFFYNNLAPLISNSALGRV